jgi:branched-chain amino acid transport system ATP-binding protein
LNEPLLSVEGLSVHLGGRPVVRDLSMQVQRGEIVLLVGHNGSGKSTLLKTIAGLIPAQSGTITVSTGIGEHPCSILLQEENVFLDRTVEQNVAIGATGRFRLALSARADIRSRIETAFPELSSETRRKCAKLSGGMRQLSALCRTLLTPRPIQLLDEPTVGLAPPLARRSLDTLFTAIRSNSYCAIIAEHNFQAALDAVDRLCVMRNGELVYDGDVELARDMARFREFYF